MDNYDYSPQELKIIMDIANKHKIPISLGDNSIMVRSEQDFAPLMMFSTNGFDIPIAFNFNTLNYYKEIGKNLKIFMQEKVALKL